MTENEYLEKLSKFKLSEKDELQILLMPFILVGTVDKRLSIQEASVLDVYENDIINIIGINKTSDPEGFYGNIIKIFEASPFSYVDDVGDIVNYNLNLLDEEKKIRIKNILISGMYMIASASKENPSDKAYISPSEKQMISKLIKLFNLDSLASGKKLLAITAD